MIFVTAFPDIEFLVYGAGFTHTPFGASEVREGINPSPTFYDRLSDMNVKVHPRLPAVLTPMPRPLIP